MGTRLQGFYLAHFHSLWRFFLYTYISEHCNLYYRATIIRRNIVINFRYLWENLQVINVLYLNCCSNRYESWNMTLKVHFWSIIESMKHIESIVVMDDYHHFINTYASNVIFKVQFQTKNMLIKYFFST